MYQAPDVFLWFVILRSAILKRNQWCASLGSRSASVEEQTGFFQSDGEGGA